MIQPAAWPPDEVASVDTDPRCLKCGGFMDWVDCHACGGDGIHELYDDDPLWYDEDDVEPCETCDGRGGWRVCLTCNPAAADD